MPQRLATAVTEVFAPTVLVTLLLVLATVDESGISGLVIAFVAVAFVAAAPFAVVYLAVRRGVLTDHHVSIRQQRAVVLGATSLSIIIGLGVLSLLNAPKGLFLMVLCVLVGLLLVLLANLVWKLSAHAAVAAFFCLACIVLYGAPAVISAAVPPVVGWSRVALGAHTRGQVIGGSAVGVAVAIVYAMAYAHL